MPDDDDRSLLRAWVENRNEAAFRRLVERYAGMVHGAAFRRTNNAELAADAAQDVFIRLARNAAGIRRPDSLPAWLHAAALHAASDRIRSESRHRDRMNRFLQSQSDGGGDAPPWRDALPLLDEAIARLNEPDRSLVIARYGQGESVADAARRCGLTNAATQKRGERALQKLASFLRRRGVALTVSALASGLATHLSHAAPPGAAVQWSAASTASTASSASGSGAWIALMNSKAASIAAAVLAMCVPVGMQLNANATAHATAGQATASQKTGPQKSEARKPFAAQPSPILVNGVDFSALAREIRAFPPPAGRLRRELELCSVMSALDATQCATVADWLVDAPRSSQLSWVMESLLRRWTELDREGAVAASHALENRSPHFSARHAVLSIWADQDPLGMLARFAPEIKKTLEDETHPAQQACEEAVRSLARRDPRAAIETAKKIHAEHSIDLFQATLMGWADGASPEQPLAWLETEADPQHRAEWYQNLIGYLQGTQPEKAWPSLLRWPDRAVAQDLACSTLNLWCSHDSNAAVAAWLSGPAELKNKHFAFNLAHVLGYANPSLGQKLAEELPDPDLRKYFAGIMESIKSHSREGSP